MAGRNAQERFRILERRKRVAGMYLQGMSQWEIGRQLGVTQQCIAKDVHALEKEWLASAVVAIDAAKAKELARIDRLERVAWRAWRRSCQRKEKATTRMERKLDEDAQKAKTVTSKATELRDGNPEYLKRVEWCISKRCELLKLNPPQRKNCGHEIAIDPAGRIAPWCSHCGANVQREPTGTESGTGAADLGGADRHCPPANLSQGTRPVGEKLPRPEPMCFQLAWHEPAAFRRALEPIRPAFRWIRNFLLALFIPTSLGLAAIYGFGELFLPPLTLIISKTLGTGFLCLVGVHSSSWCPPEYCPVTSPSDRTASAGFGRYRWAITRWSTVGGSPGKTSRNCCTLKTAPLAGEAGESSSFRAWPVKRKSSGLRTVLVQPDLEDPPVRVSGLRKGSSVNSDDCTGRGRGVYGFLLSVPGSGPG